MAAPKARRERHHANTVAAHSAKRSTLTHCQAPEAAAAPSPDADAASASPAPVPPESALTRSVASAGAAATSKGPGRDERFGGSVVDAVPPVHADCRQRDLAIAQRYQGEALLTAPVDVLGVRGRAQRGLVGIHPDALRSPDVDLRELVATQARRIHDDGPGQGLADPQLGRIPGPLLHDVQVPRRQPCLSRELRRAGADFEPVLLGAQAYPAALHEEPAEARGSGTRVRHFAVEAHRGDVQGAAGLGKDRVSPLDHPVLAPAPYRLEAGVPPQSLHQRVRRTGLLQGAVEDLRPVEEAEHVGDLRLHVGRLRVDLALDEYTLLRTGAGRGRLQDLEGERVGLECAEGEGRHLELAAPAGGQLHDPAGGRGLLAAHDLDLRADGGAEHFEVPVERAEVRSGSRLAARALDDQPYRLVGAYRVSLEDGARTLRDDRRAPCEHQQGDEIGPVRASPRATGAFHRDHAGVPGLRWACVHVGVPSPGSG